MNINELIKRLKFQVHYRFDEIVIKSKSEWANDDIAHFVKYLKETGAEEVDEKRLKL